MSVSYDNAKGSEITQRQRADWSQVPRKRVAYEDSAHFPSKLTSISIQLRRHVRQADKSDGLKSQMGCLMVATGRMGESGPRID